jgi:hypothetical protein
MDLKIIILRFATVLQNYNIFLKPFFFSQKVIALYRLPTNEYRSNRS